jgi:hypothetical protein
VTILGRAALVAAAIGLALLPIPPGVVERWYSNGAYPVWQHFATSASNRAPFALFDAALVVLTGWLFWQLARHLRDRRRRWAARIGRLIVTLATAAAAVYIGFLGAWGMNYRRVPIREKVPFDAAMISLARAKTLAATAVANVNALHDAAHATAVAPDDGIDRDLVAAFREAERLLGVSHPAIVGQPKRTLLDPYFKAAAVDGMTDPFLLETLVVSDLLPFERPLVIAHEWSHLAGFADESEANFAGWLACVHGTPASKYSGWLFLYSEVSGGLPSADRAAAAAQLEEGPREDLRAVAERIRRDVRPLVFAGAWRTYDRYLKANRVAAGTASYAQVVQLVLGTRFDADWRPLR